MDCLSGDHFYRKFWKVIVGRIFDIFFLQMRKNSHKKPQRIELSLPMDITK